MDFTPMPCSCPSLWGSQHPLLRTSVSAATVLAWPTGVPGVELAHMLQMKIVTLILNLNVMLPNVILSIFYKIFCCYHYFTCNLTKFSISYISVHNLIHLILQCATDYYYMHKVMLVMVKMNMKWIHGVSNKLLYIDCNWYTVYYWSPFGGVSPSMIWWWRFAESLFLLPLPQQWAPVVAGGHGFGG